MTDPQYDPKLPEDLLDHVRRHQSRFLWLGIGLIVLGILAVLFPLLASIAAKVMIGWFLLITGGIVLWHAFQARVWQGALLSGLIGVLHLAAGVYLAFFPLTGLIGLTLLTGVLFGLQGGIEVSMGLSHRPAPRWGWMVFSGVASLAMAVLLIAGLPGTALWAIGLILGINFITSGFAFVALSRV